jgi:hypothetical protein
MKKIIILALSLLVTACGPGNEDFGGGVTPGGTTTHFIFYSIEGPFSRVAVVYQNGQGGISQEIVNVPWQKQLVAIPGQLLSVSAQNQDSAGYLTVGIAIDGIPYKQATGLGAFATATATGACC